MQPRTLRAWLGYVLVATIATAPVQAEARATKAPTLEGTTVLAAASSASMPVRLDRPLDLRRAPGGAADPRVTVDAPERLVALVLVADRQVRRDGEPYSLSPTVIAASMPTPTGPRVFLTARHLDNAFVAPAGSYRLFVITRGPVRVTWTLPLPAGTTSLRPSRPVDAPFEIEGSATTVPLMAISAGGHHRTGPRAQVWELAYARGTHVQLVGDIAFCLYRGDDPRALATADLPAPVCDGFGGNFGPISNGIFVPPPVEDFDEIMYSGMTPVDEEQRVNSDLLPVVGTKFTAALTGTATYTSTFQLWLPLT